MHRAALGAGALSDEWAHDRLPAHVEREDFVFLVAREAGELTGFGYGFTGAHGQWWTDRAAKVLDPEVAAAWLGGHFELVSIGVVPACRGRGLGRDLLRAVTDGLPHDRWLLMTTADEDDPARRLYAREGWTLLGPGIGENQVVLGRRR